MSKKLFLLIALLVVLMAPLSVLAYQKSQKDIYVGENEVINSNYFNAGQNVEIRGTMNKDVIVAGAMVRISGLVRGDVIAVGAKIIIDGPVEGNVRVAGSDVTINGPVGKNITAAGGNVVLNSSAQAGWDLITAGGNVEIKSPVQGDLLAAGGNIIVDSQISGNAQIYSERQGKITLYPTSHIAGDLTYQSGNFDKKEGAQIGGQTFIKDLKPTAEHKKWLLPVLGIGWLIFKIIGLFGLLVVGLVLTVLMKKKMIAATDYMLKKPWICLGWGLVFLIVTPVICFLSALTIIGLPLAFILLASYLIALYVSKVVVSIMIGRSLLSVLKSKSKNVKEKSLLAAMILGVVVFVILTNIPLIGGFLCFIGVLWGLGALVEMKKLMLKEMR